MRFINFISVRLIEILILSLLGKIKFEYLKFMHEDSISNVKRTKINTTVSNATNVSVTDRIEEKQRSKSSEINTRLESEESKNTSNIVDR
jgi:hypothetical protein